MDLKPYDVKNILSNLEKVFSKKDIKLLSKKSYEFLYMMSGFIGHYDIHGFKNAYSDLRELLNDIEGALPIEKDVAIRDIDDPKHNGYGLPYCQSKLDIVEGLKIIVEKYKNEVSVEGSKIDDDKFELLKECVKRCEKDLEFRKTFIDKVFA